MKSSTQNTDEELLRNDNVNDNVPTPNHPDKHTNTNKNAASKHQPHRSKSRTDIWLERASNMPLVAALLAPLSTLLDIPALTQRWYTLSQTPIPDPPPCIALSALGLSLNVLANALLLARFSKRSQRFWNPATTASTGCWVGKTVVALVNVAVFGARKRNEEGYAYTEAFWSAIASVILAGIISILLLAHYFLAFRTKREDKTVKVQGAKFLLSISFLLFVIGALVYSSIEDWSYFDAIYYSVVTMLTIGFGDLAPTKVASKILLLPFAVVTISQLANEVSIIVRYFSQRSQSRKNLWRARVDRTTKLRAQHPSPDYSLADEIKLINKIASRDELLSECYDLAWSFSSLLVFWLVGAAVFSSIEGWTFWNAWYFEIVFSLTIGYGDFSPQTPGGRVFFVIYAFGAVPLVASFTVQAVTGLLSTYFSSGASRYGRNHDAELPTSDALKPHKYFVLKHRGQILELGLSRPETETSMDVVVDEMVTEKPSALPVTSGNVDNRQLTQELIECTIVLEAIARRLLIDSMPSNTIGRTILEADHNIQIRDVQALGGDMEILATLGRAKLDLTEDSELPVAAASESGQALEQIRRYREMFARVLVTASTLQRLEGVERYQFERMRGEDLVSEG